MKILSLLLLLFCTPAIASATEKYISYEDFVHFSFDKKVETISLVQKFLNEYEHQIKYRKTRLKKSSKYQTYIKIFDYFISSAHAMDMDKDVLPENIFNGEDKCYYGGWISMVQVYKGRAYCVHPKRLTLVDKQVAMAKQTGIILKKTDDGNGIENNESYKKFEQSEQYKHFIEDVSSKYKGYFAQTDTKTLDVTFDNEGKVILTENNKGCNQPGTENIACNPDIYGKIGSKNEQRTLCIPTGRNAGLNVSYMCNKALEHLKNTDKPQFDSAMKYIIDAAIADQDNGNSFFKTLSSMYDTCLCGGAIKDSSIETSHGKPLFSNKINKNYAKNLFTSRTCAGIISQTVNLNDAIVNACNAGKKIGHTDDVKWIKYLTDISKNTLLNTNFQNIGKVNISSKKEHGLFTNDKGNLDRSEIKEYFTTDKALFGNLANANYQEAKSQGLCPILEGNPIITNPLVATAAVPGSSLNLIASGYILQKNKLYNILDIELIIDDKKIPLDAKNSKKLSLIDTKSDLVFQPTEKSFITTVKEKLFKTKASYSGTTPSLQSTPVEIKPPEATCKIEITDGVVKVSPSVEVNGFDLAKNMDKLKLKAVFGKTPLKSVEKSHDTFSLSKNQEKVKNPFVSVNGSIAVGGIPLKLNCKLGKKNKAKAKKAQIASCKVNIKSEKNDKGEYTLTAEVDLGEKKGKKKANYSAEEIIDLVSINWYNITGKAGKKKKGDDKKTVGIRKKADKKKGKPKTDDISKAGKIKKGYDIIQNKELTLGPIPRAATDQKFAVLIEPKVGDVKCEVTEFKVPKKEAVNPANNSAYQQKPNSPPQSNGNSIIRKGVQ